MVMQIVDKILQNKEEGVDLAIGDYLEETMPNFTEAIHLLEKYALKCSICLPDCCESVVEIFGEDYGYSFQLDQITEESEENVIYGSIF